MFTAKKTGWTLHFVVRWAVKGLHIVEDFWEIGWETKVCLQHQVCNPFGLIPKEIFDVLFGVIEIVTLHNFTAKGTLRIEPRQNVSISCCFFSLLVFPNMFFLEIVHRWGRFGILANSTSSTKSPNLKLSVT